MRRHVWLRAMIVTMAVIWACGDEVIDPIPDPPDPGFVSVRLVTPNFNDGAVRFTLAGAGIDSVTSVPGKSLFREVLGGERQRLVVVGLTVRGIVAEFWIPDRNRMDEIVAVVEEAAANVTFAQQVLTGYQIALDRRP